MWASTALFFAPGWVIELLAPEQLIRQVSQKEKKKWHTSSSLREPVLQPPALLAVHHAHPAVARGPDVW